MLPRGDGEVQDVVEAVRGRVEASCPTDAWQVLVAHQELGWQSRVHSYPVPGGVQRGELRVSQH